METRQSKKIFFENDGRDFSGIHKAEQWCRENGYSYGSMQRGERIGVAKGDCYISKWRNLSQDDIDSLEGYINHDGKGYREGTVGIVIFDTPAK